MRGCGGRFSLLKMQQPSCTRARLCAPEHVVSWPALLAHEYDGCGAQPRLAPAARGVPSLNSTHGHAVIRPECPGGVRCAPHTTRILLVWGAPT